MSQKYHIGKNGPAPCRASKRACRFGGDTQHYTSLEDAQHAYEEKMNNNLMSHSNPYHSITQESFVENIDLNDYIAHQKTSVTGKVSIQYSLVDSLGRFHAEGKPAIIEKDPQSGHILRQVWMVHGVTHREDGPALLTYDPHDKCFGQTFIRENKLCDPHDDTPAESLFYDNGLSYHSHYTDGLSYRSDTSKPSEYYLSAEGKPLEEEWHDNHGDVKRSPYDGPCSIRYHENGNPSEVRYGSFNQPSREDGPAYVSYSDTGTLIEEKYMIHGKPVSETDNNGIIRPAHITYYPDGSVHTETWLSNDGNNNYIREKVSQEKTYSEGEKQRETWTLETTVTHMKEYYPDFSV